MTANQYEETQYYQARFYGGRRLKQDIIELSLWNRLQQVTIIRIS